MTRLTFSVEARGAQIELAIGVEKAIATDFAQWGRKFVHRMETGQFRQVELKIGAMYWPVNCPYGVIVLACPANDGSRVWRYHGYPLGADGMAIVNPSTRFDGLIIFDIWESDQ